MVAIQLLALDADSHKAMFGAPGTLGRFDMDGKGMPITWRSVLVIEIVDQLFDPHGIRWRQGAMLHQVLASFGVRRRVDVDREGGKRVVANGKKIILRKMVEPVASLPWAEPSTDRRPIRGRDHGRGRWHG